MTAPSRIKTRPIPVAPLRHASPPSPDYEDGGAIVAFERAMRVHRAFTEPFVVTPLDSRVDGAYRVANEGGRDYLVDIVDASRANDACTCPDFLGNQLGVCKHVEAVRRAIAENAPLRRAYASLGRAPGTATLCVDGRDGLRLHVVGPHAARLVRAVGRGDAGDVHVPHGVGLRGGVRNDGSRIVHAAAIAGSRLAERAARTTRARAVEDAIRTSALRLDVLTKPLFSYQRDGVRHLAAAGRALLADDMGLGKTVQAIAACQVLRARGEARRILIVCPASLKAQWATEIARYAGERAVVVGGDVRSRRAALESDAPYTILNYELTWRDLSILREIDADVLVLDEAQRAKNFRTKTADTLKAIPTRFLFVLTGTPVENRLDDLYGLLQLVDPEVLGPLWKFNYDFHVQGERGKIVGCKNLSGLRERIAPVVLRRRKEEVLAQLPPLTEQTRYTPLSAEQEELEASFRQSAAQLMAQAERRALTPKEQQRLMSALLKARQACNAAVLCDPESRDGSAKLDELAALVTEISSQGSSKILVFSEWTEMLTLAAARLDELGVGHLMLHGGVPTEKRAALIDRFRQDGEVTVLLSTDAGGVGLNLQAASYVIHLDLPWNPGRLDQRIARAHRLGQTRGVSVTYLCAEAGIERGIEGTLSGKRAIRGAALDAASTVDELEAPSFSVFLRQMQKTMAEVEGRAGDDETPPASEERVAVIAETPVTPAATTNGDRKIEAPRSAPAPSSRTSVAYARERLRLATIVLQAGFPADAVRASYEALSASLRSLAPEPVAEGHGPLVASVYRDLLPTGRVPAFVPALLGRVRDLGLLEEHAIPLDGALAAETIREVGEWLARLDERPAADRAAASAATA